MAEIRFRMCACADQSQCTGYCIVHSSDATRRPQSRFAAGVVEVSATPHNMPEDPQGALPPLDRQVAGSHYKDQPIQPVEYIHANALGYFEGNVVKYVSRWRKKGGVADLEKAKHYIDLLIELEARHAG
jgi:hypothetical protein